MAKWEEKDSRWVVEDRQDGSNVNGVLSIAPTWALLAPSKQKIPMLSVSCCRLALGGEKSAGVEQTKA